MATNKTHARQALGRAVAGADTDLSGLADVQLLELARQHGVGPLLERSVRRGTATGLSETAAGALHEDSRGHAALDLVLNEATRRFCALLAEAGVEALLLKGTPVAHLFYPQAWLRTRCDTDVLIRPEQVSALAALLRQHGYQVVNLDLSGGSSKQFQACRERFQGRQMWFEHPLPAE